MTTERISDATLDDLIERMDSIYSAKILHGMYPIIPVEDYQRALRELRVRRKYGQEYTDDLLSPKGKEAVQ